MTYNWYDTRASTWYEGYGPGGGTSHTAEGNFVDLRELEGSAYDEAHAAIRDNIIGLMEMQGITGNVAASSDAFTDAMNMALAGDTAGAFQTVAGGVSSAHDRGDLWGADSREGGDRARGRSFIEDVASGAATASISDLYTSGFGREADTTGLTYWQDMLDTGTMTIEEIAGAFGSSEEATMRDHYHTEYGRDADADGLAYWMSEGEYSGEGAWEDLISSDHHKVSDGSDALHDALTYRGETNEYLEGLGVGVADINDLSPGERRQYMRDAGGIQMETFLRDEFRDVLGQISREEDRFFGANDHQTPFFTAAEAGDVQSYMDRIDANLQGYGIWDAITDINMRGTGMDAISQGDQDDFFQAYDSNEDGVIDERDAEFEGERGFGILNDPTYMSRFATRANISTLMDNFTAGGGQFSVDPTGTRADGTAWDLPENVADWSDEQRLAGHPGMQDFLEYAFSTVMGDTWDALDEERPKTLDDLVGILPHGQLIPEHAELLLAKSNLPLWKQRMTAGTWEGYWNRRNSGDGQEGWEIDPQRPTLDPNLDVNRENVDYTPTLTSDVQDTSRYGQASDKFQRTMSTTPTTPGVAEPARVGERLTDTSAQGVRTNRSRASRMGTIRGTKQLGREQQLTSLNI